jgi:hypothetical protein
MSPHAHLAPYALIAALCSLVPLPFLDDIARRQVMRAAYASIAHELGQPQPEAALVALTRSKRSLLVGCFLGILWWPIRKLFRTVVFFLAAKDFVDQAGEAAVRGLLVHRALERQLLPNHAESVREAIDAAWEKAGKSAALRAYRRPASAPPEATFLVSLTHRLADGADHASVHEAFERELSRRITGPAP